MGQGVVRRDLREGRQVTRAELAEQTVAETVKALGCEPDNEAMLQRIADLRAENEHLRAALIDSRDCIEAWGLYAAPYFQQKHDLAGDIRRANEALGEKPCAS